MVKKDNLETKHKTILKDFSKKKKILTELNAKKVRITLEISKLKKSSTKKTKLTQDLYKIIDDIKSINVEEEQHKYFLNTAQHLHEYYTKKSTDVNTDNNNKQTGSIRDIVKTVCSTNKHAILEQYMTKLNPDYETTILEIDDASVCDCGTELTLKRDDAELVCLSCGQSYHDVIYSEKKSYNSVPPDIMYYAYRRINHFNELLAQFQAKETTNIPVEVYDQIRNDLKKKRYYDLDKLTPKFMRSILKKLKLTTYYDNVPYIIHKLNGKPILTITRETTNKLRNMFIQLQEPFVSCCPSSRHNWPNYNYTFYKLFEILGLDQFLHCFPFLKDPEKMYTLDKIWKCMCGKLKWEFIRTV